MTKKLIKETVVEPVVEILPIKQIKVKKIKNLGVEIPKVVMEAVEINDVIEKPKRILSDEQKEKMKLGRMKALEA